MGQWSNDANTREYVPTVLEHCCLCCRFQLTPFDSSLIPPPLRRPPLQELFCIFPLVNKVMMRLASFDDTGRITTQGVPGTMIVDMVFSDETNENTGQTDWFNKRERFKDTCFGFTCWDMVINYGFRTKEDGTLECYHCGERSLDLARVLNPAPRHLTHSSRSL